MRNPTLLYGVITVLGIALLTIFFPIPLFFPALNLFSYVWIVDFTILLLISCFFSIVGVVFLTAGICGIGSRHFKNIQILSALQPNHVGEPRAKHIKPYGFIAVLGVVFLGVFPAILYWSERSAEVARFFMHTPLAGYLLFIVSLFGGTGFLTIGVCGIARQYFKNNQNLFTILIAISIPSLIFIPVLYWWLSLLTVGF